MPLRTNLVFWLLTLLVLVGAIVSISERSEVIEEVSLQKVFKDLENKLQDVHKISIKNRENAIDLSLKNKEWVLTDRNNFIASEEVVKGLLLAVSELKLKESKTSREELLPRLHVEDVSKKDSKSILLVLRDQKNKVIAELIIGKEAEQMAGVTGIGRYVRKPEEQTAWLAEGNIEAFLDVNKWVNPKVINISKERIKQVTVMHKNDPIMTVVPVGGTTKKFKIVNFPAGREIEYQSDIDNMAEGLEDLELEDVKQFSTEFLNKKGNINSQYNTKDGLVINVTAFEDKVGEFWGHFSVKAKDNVAKSVVDEAKAINSRVEKWIYSLPAHKYRYMTRKVEDVLKPLKKKTAK